MQQVLLCPCRQQGADAAAIVAQRVAAEGGPGLTMESHPRLRQGKQRRSIMLLRRRRGPTVALLAWQSGPAGGALHRRAAGVGHNLGRRDPRYR